MATFTITWPDDTIEQDKLDFLLAAPNQTTGEDEENLTDLQWIKRKIILMVKGTVMQGRRMRQEAEAESLTEPEITIG